MKPYFALKSLVAAWFVCLMVGFCCGESMAEPAISALEIQRFVSMMTETMNRRNFQKLKSFYAPDTVIYAYRNGKAFLMNYSDLDASLKTTSRQVMTYHQKNRIDSVRIQGNRAEVHSTAEEAMSLRGGGKLKSVARMVMTLEKRNGVLLIVRELDNIRSETSN